MNELVSTRIRGHATWLVLPHLAENLEGLVARAEADTKGYREFVDCSSGRRSVFACVDRCAPKCSASDRSRQQRSISRFPRRGEVVPRRDHI